jgi:hypothetical protein
MFLFVADEGAHVGRFQPIVGPLGGNASHCAQGLLQIVLELGRPQRRHRATAETFDQRSNPL